jgi:hypothetical protein
MANALYNLARQSFLSQNPSIDLDTDNIKVVLVSGYAVNIATHQFLSDVTGLGGGTIAATSGNLAGKSVTDGIFDATDVTFTAVPAGVACGYLVIYKDTGAAGTSPLIAYIDTATNLAITPNGGDITIVWDGGVNKIFKL